MQIVYLATQEWSFAVGNANARRITDSCDRHYCPQLTLSQTSNFRRLTVRLGDREKTLITIRQRFARVEHLFQNVITKSHYHRITKVLNNLSAEAGPLHIVELLTALLSTTSFTNIVL